MNTTGIGTASNTVHLQVNGGGRSTRNIASAVRTIGEDHAGKIRDRAGSRTTVRYPVRH